MKTILLLTATALLAVPMAADAGRRQAAKPAVKKTTAADAALQAALEITSSFANCSLTSSALVSVGTAGQTVTELALNSSLTSTPLVASASQAVAETAPPPPVFGNLPGGTTPNPVDPGTPTNPPTFDPATVIVNEEKPATSAP